MNNIELITLSKDGAIFYSDQIIDILDSDTIVSNPWTRQNVEIDLPGKWRYSSIAVSEDKVHGFCICSRKDLATVHIHKIYVHPLFLGYGLGKRLIAKMIDVCMCDEITNISLYTFISRKTAYNWYLKLGFEVSKTLDFNTRAFMIGKVAIIKRNLGETN